LLHDFPTCRGGEEEIGGRIASFQDQHRWLPAWCYLRIFFDELNHTDGLLASVIFCRHGGISKTSSEEALLPSCWSSAPGFYQVVRPRWIRGVRRRRIFAGSGCSGICALLLGGDVLGAPATGGGGIQGLDCIPFLSSRVFSVIWQALSSNLWFFSARVEKWPVCKIVTRHVLE
jgi:hypothetical protein